MSKEDVMISKECKFSDFVGSLRDKDFFEILDLANQEATAAERLGLQPRVDPAVRQRCGKQYAEQIKRLIACMRYAVKPRSACAHDAELFAVFAPERKPRRGI
jgi:hypothetical protein